MQVQHTPMRSGGGVRSPATAHPREGDALAGLGARPNVAGHRVARCSKAPAQRSYSTPLEARRLYESPVARPPQATTGRSRPRRGPERTGGPRRRLLRPWRADRGVNPEREIGRVPARAADAGTKLPLGAPRRACRPPTGGLDVVGHIAVVWGRAGASADARSATSPPSPSTATSASGRSTGWRKANGSGWPARVPSPRPGWARCWSAGGVRRPWSDPPPPTRRRPPTCEPRGPPAARARRSSQPASSAGLGPSGAPCAGSRRVWQPPPSEPDQVRTARSYPTTQRVG